MNNTITSALIEGQSVKLNYNDRDGRELTVRLSLNYSGLNLHFTGLGSDHIGITNTYANGFNVERVSPSNKHLPKSVVPLPRRDAKGRFKAASVVLYFDYKGYRDTKFHPRRVKLIEETAQGFKGIDLDKGKFRYFLKNGVSHVEKMKNFRRVREYLD